VNRHDRTTVAERFFGAKPRDIFEWILERWSFQVGQHRNDHRQRARNTCYWRPFESVAKTNIKAELFSELKKLKFIQIGNNEPFIGELSKKQKIIFKAFDIKEDITIFHGY